MQYCNIRSGFDTSLLWYRDKAQRTFKKVDCYVGKFENIQRNFWLYELSDFGKLTKEVKLCYKTTLLCVARLVMKYEWLS